MLDQKKKNYSETKVVTIIGPGTVITGEVKCQGTIRIEGMVAGRVHSDDTIVIHDTGRVKADLFAGQVIVGGEVEGNVFAQDRIEVTAKGRLIGDITAPRVSIADGVIFEGKCTMKAPGQVQPALAPGQPPRVPAPVQPPKAPAPESSKPV
jgi:cytoskeletal protein CcmA (bactofilin family)